MTPAEKLRKNGRAAAEKRAARKSVWRGPEEDGVTFSLLSRFLVCRERFRLLVVEGLKPAPQFNHKVEYGQMWHVCEEALAAGAGSGISKPWVTPLIAYCQELCKKYPTQQTQVDKWYNVCKAQFPLYVAYWQEHEDEAGRTPLSQEQVFDVPYRLPSGRTVRLRGKRDSVDLIRRKSKEVVYLKENKTKGNIKPALMQRQLKMDLQTMMYLVSIELDEEVWDRVRSLFEGKGRRPIRIGGVRYNVVRRPLSGGKGDIRQHKPTKKNPRGESKADYYKRLGEVIAGKADEFFMRWDVEVTPRDVEKFRKQVLDPVLEQLCDWWEWISSQVAYGDPFYATQKVGYKSDFGSGENGGIHWRHPYGVFNVLDEGGSHDLDTYLDEGNSVGLRRVDELFPELK